MLIVLWMVVYLLLMPQRPRAPIDFTWPPMAPWLYRYDIFHIYVAQHLCYAAVAAGGLALIRKLREPPPAAAQSTRRENGKSETFAPPASVCVCFRRGPACVCARRAVTFVHARGCVCVCVCVCWGGLTVTDGRGSYSCNSLLNAGKNSQGYTQLRVFSSK